MPIILPGVDAGLPMSFVELQDEVILTRFRESQRASICRWINWRYQWVNSQAEWPWLSPYVYTRAWPGGSPNGVALEEATNRRVLEVWDDSNDQQLDYLPYDEFQVFFGGDVESGEPTHWSLSADDTDKSALLYIGPLGSSATSLRMVTDLRPVLLAGDGDFPVWPSAWHFALVLGATATGLKLENDPTWEALETEFLAAVELMKEELLPPHQPEPRQFGRQPFDLWA